MLATVQLTAWRFHYRVKHHQRVAVGTTLASGITFRPLHHEMNFKRPCWFMLFGLLALAALGYGGAVATPVVFHFFHSHYEKLGPQDLLVIGFGLMMGIGVYGAAIAAIWCLFSTVFTILRSERMKKILYDGN